MLGRPKKAKARKNRYKKSRGQLRHRWLQRAYTSAKLFTLTVLLLVTSAAFMVGYAAVTRSDYFRTRNIEVTGNGRLSRAEVLSQAEIEPGDNSLALNLRLVRKRLLAHPWIVAARVGREIPATIVIQIEEHIAVARIDMGRTFLMNSHGRIFKELDSTDAIEVPLVTGVGYADISLGKDALSPALAAVMKVLKINRTKAGTLPYGAIERLHLDKEIGITLTLKSNQRLIKLGFNQFEKKYRRLQQLLPRLKRNDKWREFHAIDVNNPDRIVVQLG